MAWKIFHTILTTMINEECRKSVSLTCNEDSTSEDEEDESETDDDDDHIDEDLVLKSKKIERLDVWKTQNGLQITTVKTNTKSPEFPIEFQKFEFKHTYIWNEDSLTMDDTFTDLLLDELRRLTRCTFSKDSENNLIFIGSNIKEDLSMAICKMKNIVDYLHLSTPFVYHILYTEADKNVKLAFLRLANAKNRLFKTTLLNSLKESCYGYEEMYKNAVTIRYAPYDSLHDIYKISWRLKITPTQSEKNIGLELKNWESPRYFARGSRNTDSREWKTSQVASTSSTTIPTTASRKKLLGLVKQNTMNWIENIANSVPTQVPPNRSPAITIAEPTRQRRSESKISEGKRGPAKPSWDSFQEPVPKAFKENLQIMAANLKILVEDSIEKPTQNTGLKSNTDSEVTQRFNTPANTKTNQGNIENHPQQPSHLLDSDPSLEFNDILRRPLSPIRHGMSTLIPSLNSSLYQRIDSENYATQDIYCARNFVANILDDDSLDCLPYDALTPTRKESLTAHHATIKSEDLGKMTGNHKDMILVTEVIPDRLHDSILQEEEQDVKTLHTFKNISGTEAKKFSQLSFETETPKFLEIEKLKIIGTSSSESIEIPAMVDFSQQNKKPPVAQSIKPGRGNFLENSQHQLLSSFGLMMERIRGYRGELSIETNFGRIIIKGLHDRYVANKNLSEKIFTAEKTREILMDNSVLTSGFEFTKILTTRLSEIEHLITIKNSQGNNYWMPKRAETSLTYELCFSDKGSLNSRFIIEINAENFTTKIKTLSELGNIYVHGTKRFWDFRLSATGAGRKTELSALYGELARMVSKSVFIPENCTYPDLYWEITESLNDRYSLEEVTVHHVGRHISRDNKSMLQICEVRSLEVSWVQSPDKNSVMYHALFNNEDLDSPQKLRMWFEVSISSKELDALLIKNQALELGELVDWTKELLDFDSIAQNIFLSACSTLESLDGIGSYNDNEYNMESKTAVTPSATSQAYYW
ncbi:hypothetical protein K3495_g2002 [Podosphaera aphanis]|nr:hypothetical protein K3495_g2002 [Podosphaera aphanis]